VDAGPCSREDALAQLDGELQRAKRTLTPSQRARVAAVIDTCRRPLFVTLVAEEAKRWHSGQAAVLPHVDSPDEALNAVIVQLLRRLSEPAHHGEALVERTLGYLAASRYGLAEDELKGLLATDQDFLDAFRNAAARAGQPLRTTSAVPDAVWARLFSDLQPYVRTRWADGTTLLGFFHQTFTEVVRRRYLADPPTAAARHRHIADYLSPKAHVSGWSWMKFRAGMGDPRPRRNYFRLSEDELRHQPLTPPRTRPVLIRAVMELPHQLVRAAVHDGRWYEAAELFQDIHFLEARAEA